MLRRLVNSIGAAGKRKKGTILNTVNTAQHALGRILLRISKTVVSDTNYRPYRDWKTFRADTGRDSPHTGKSRKMGPSRKTQDATVEDYRKTDICGNGTVQYR